jgi:outer membrane lipoprotein LolB
MSAARLAVALIAALAVGGCATIRVGTDGLSFAERRARLEAVPAWEARGSLVVTTPNSSNQPRFSWLQEGEHLTLDIRPRVGPTVLHVEGTPDELVVIARGDRHVLTDPEAQLPTLIEGGWWIPVTSLRSWLLGLPDPEYRADSDRGTDGTLERLAQRLWDVEYTAYQLVATPQGDTLLPRTIELKHGDLALRVTLAQWAPLASEDAP